MKINLVKRQAGKECSYDIMGVDIFWGVAYL